MTDIGLDAALMEPLDEGSMREVVAGDRKILVARDEAGLHAVSATCPHAGAPLAQGILHGSRLVCPWHKAVFCIRTGAVLEPPAVDPLECFDIKTKTPLPAPAAAARPAAPDKRVFVIVGAGGAGAVAAQTLREHGFGGRIVMLDRANRVPYDRTLLSKYALSGEQGAEKSPLQSQSYYKSHAIERVAADVTSLDTKNRQIDCADGSTWRYDAVLLAPGGLPQPTDLEGADLGGVFTLRSRADADAILARAEGSERAVVLGTGFIGMEVAASLTERGLAVTVVGRDSVPLEKQLGKRIGGAVRALHESKGVRFRLGGMVRSLTGHGHVEAVLMPDREALPADLVVVGFGVRPATAFVTDIPLNADGSLTVDATLRAADGVFAAGDIARFPLHGDGPAIRVEHWRVAQQQGRTAALNMLGHETRHTATPVFWTIQYLKRLDYVGHATDWDDIVLHGDLGQPEFLAYFVKNGIVRAAAGMDRDQDTAALCELLDLRRDWTPTMLSDRPAAVLASLPPTSTRRG